MSRELTGRQIAFCDGIGAGLSQTEAYVRAYGWENKRSSARQRASKLILDPRVVARIAGLRAAAAERHKVSVDDIARQLAEDREFAREKGSAAAAVSASVALAKLYGLMGDKVDVTHGMRAEDARQVVASILGRHAADVLKR